MNEENISKAKKYGIAGVIFGGLGNTLLNAINQLKEIDKNPELNFDWKNLFVAGLKGAAVGGAVGLGIGAIEDYQNSLKKPINTDAFLFGLASRIKLKKTDREYLKLSERVDILTAILKKKFAFELKSDPIRIGSTEKGTALKSKFDIDICLAFHPKSFRSTEAMFETVFSFLEKKIGKYGIVEVRDQKKSIGVFINVFTRIHKVDIVPYKLSSGHKNNSTGYLFVNNNSSLISNSSYTKTDIRTIQKSRLSNTQKKIVIVLKHWKQKNDLPLNSHLLENLVIDAYEYNLYRIPRSFTKKIIMVMEHIADNLDVAVIKSIENTNNILTNISSESKTAIINACIQAIEDYKYQPNSVVDIFER